MKTVHVYFTYRVDRGEIYQLHIKKEKTDSFSGNYDEIVYYGEYDSHDKKYVVVANPDINIKDKVWFTNDPEKFIEKTFVQTKCEDFIKENDCGYLHKFSDDQKVPICSNFYTNGDCEGFHIINADKKYPSNVYDSDWDEWKADCISCIYYKLL